MGYAIAENLAQRDANVTLISGPTKLEINHPNIKLIRVTSADEMYDASIKAFKNADAAILSAAVADYKPEFVASEKIKKSIQPPEIKLVPTPDILKKLGEFKKKNQLLVGFALETNNEIRNAKKKLDNKNLDFIVLNSLKDKGAGFGHNTNKISIIDKQQHIEQFDLKSKNEVAVDIVNKLVSIFDSV